MNERYIQSQKQAVGEKRQKRNENGASFFMLPVLDDKDEPRRHLGRAL